MPLKQVHRITDASLLDGAAESPRAARLIAGPGLLALKLAHGTADVLEPEARRRAVLRAVEGPDRPAVREGAVTVELGGTAAELEEGLAELAAAAAAAMAATDPEILGGTLCLAGTPIPVRDLAAMLTDGDTPAALAEAYPALDHRRIRLAALHAAAWSAAAGGGARPPRPKPASNAVPTTCRRPREFLVDEYLGPTPPGPARARGRPESTHLTWLGPSSATDRTIVRRAADGAFVPTTNNTPALSRRTRARSCTRAWSASARRRA